jgi:hypothetical protein
LVAIEQFTDGKRCIRCAAQSLAFSNSVVPSKNELYCVAGDMRMLSLPNDIEVLVRLVALKTETSPERVVIEAVKAFARAVGVHDNEIVEAHRVAMMEAATAIARRSAARPVRDVRSDNDILAYNSHGISQNQAIQSSPTTWN